MRRLQRAVLWRDLQRKMVFLTGPRQVGKTWLSQDIMSECANPLYLNYDDFDHRRIIQRRSWRENVDLIIFDEIHKMPKWKNYLKGLFDTRPKSMRILVTGSARLETFRYAGDSLAGRYFHHRLLPFSLAEIEALSIADEDRLIQQGGFPEAFLSGSDDDANKWRLQYIQGLIRVDLLDFERIHDLKAIQLILDMLRRRVGSPISYQSISEDVGISPNTVKKYIQIMEELFIVFRVTPYAKNIQRALRKEPKIYFYDTGMVIGDDGARFENYVALGLLKYLYQIEDQKGKQTRLHYLKTKEGQEVDFCMVVDDRVDRVIEAKLSDDRLHAGLNYFCTKYHFPGIQLVRSLKIEQKVEAVTIRKSFSFLKDLKL